MLLYCNVARFLGPALRPLARSLFQRLLLLLQFFCQDVNLDEVFQLFLGLRFLFLYLRFEGGIREFLLCPRRNAVLVAFDRGKRRNVRQAIFFWGDAVLVRVRHRERHASRSCLAWLGAEYCHLVCILRIEDTANRRRAARRVTLVATVEGLHFRVPCCFFLADLGSVRRVAFQRYAVVKR